MKHYGDITQLHGYDLPVVDVITGGSPCQDLSIAGARKGLKHEEYGDDETTRSGLFMEQIRIVKEMREHDRANGRPVHLVRPRYMVWENVPGAFSSNGGEDFQIVLEEIVKVVEAEAPDLSGAVQGGVDKGRMFVLRRGTLEHCLARSRRAVLGSAPAKKTYRACRRFWRTVRPGNTV